MSQFISLLGIPLLACIIIAMMLSFLGIHVLKREIIFIDIALAQIVAVAAITAHIFLGAHSNSITSYGFIFAAILASALFYSVVRRHVTQISLEAIIGVTYAIAAAAALFITGTAPGGHTHVQHMLAGSILWVTWTDIVKLTVIFLIIGTAFYFLRKPFGKISDSYEDALHNGINVVWWDFLFYTLTGVIIAFSVFLGGVVLVFVFLVVPATVSALFSSKWNLRFVIACIAGVFSSLLGLIFANCYDFSVGPSVAMFAGLIIGISAIFQKSYHTLYKNKHFDPDRNGAL